MGNRNIEQKVLKIKKLKMKRRGQKGRWYDPEGRRKSSGLTKVMYYTGGSRSPEDEGYQRKFPDLSMKGRNKAAQSFEDLVVPGKPAINHPNQLSKLVLQQNPRAMILAKLIQGDRRQKVIKFVYKSLIETENLQFRLAMGGDIAFFISVKLLSTGVTRIRKSLEYGQMGKLSGLERALHALETNTIQWFTTKDIPPNSDPDTG